MRLFVDSAGRIWQRGEANFSPESGNRAVKLPTATISSRATVHGMECINRSAIFPCLRGASYTLELGLGSPVC